MLHTEPLWKLYISSRCSKCMFPQTEQYTPLTSNPVLAGFVVEYNIFTKALSMDR